ncbi:hypothetical protein CDHC01_0135 [Corynebacterium diphtheriae HC01]|nr:hypothetical protein CD241_0135 [Corynebacterium diphtheriae 241]AEX73388.1 hypothetical protein CDHC01_0135 [Corynebacterium diphtheriae HC01]AEX77837.1 hypothetical protein CDHC03_0106 [Corynebacterium diphtheriae HC03]CAB0485583.1 hypothetical protein CIP100294_00020 [Corynebacterium diphtheriae]CAB0487341.1 hypothetical protein CIP102550_00083 [Corynebacterium diphtheriae]
MIVTTTPTVEGRTIAEMVRRAADLGVFLYRLSTPWVRL